MSKGLMIAFSSPKPGREDEYLSWYRTAHMPDVVAVDGIEHGTLFEIDAGSPNQPARYFALYTLSQPPDAVLAEMTRRGQAGRIRRSDALDPASGSLMFYRKRFSSDESASG